MRLGHLCCGQLSGDRIHVDDNNVVNFINASVAADHIAVSYDMVYYGGICATIISVTASQCKYIRTNTVLRISMDNIPTTTLTKYK